MELDGGDSFAPGKYRYYGNLATVMHMIRDNSADVFLTAILVWGGQKTYDSGLHKVAPRPFMGRWRRKLECERYLRILIVVHNFSHTMFADLMERIIKKEQYYIDAAAAALRQLSEPAASAAGTNGTTRKRGHLDDTAAEEKAKSSETKGKWARRCLETANDFRFWFLMLVSHRLSEQLGILLSTVQKYSEFRRTKNKKTKKQNKNME